jgi:hypothetical protein
MLLRPAAPFAQLPEQIYSGAREPATARNDSGLRTNCNDAHDVVDEPEVMEE